VLIEEGVTATFFLTTNFIDHRMLLWFDRVGHQYLGACREGQFSELRKAILGVLKGIVLRESLTPDKSGLRFLMRGLKQSGESKRCALLEKLDELFPLDEGQYSNDLGMTWDDVRELRAKGMSIGSHTLSHALLTSVALTEKLRKEVIESKQRLEYQLGLTIDEFCYPAGHHDQVVMRLLRESGYRAAYTCQPGFNRPGTDPFRIRRINLTEEVSQGPDGRFSPCLFKSKLDGVMDLLMLRDWRCLAF
jgi:peptidoglycan/xylan/chitin deacetylase (PgdA/CDA1 family)